MKPGSAYRLALGAALATPLLLLWVIGAVGLIGVEGDPFDRVYGGVVAVAAIGAIVARLRPPAGEGRGEQGLEVTYRATSSITRCASFPGGSTRPPWGSRSLNG